jgi:hypothetical protein
MKNRMKWLPTLALLVGSTSACAQMGSLGGLGDVLGGGSSVYGEVRSVDTRRGRITVREQHGRDQTVRFDSRTRVLYRNSEYSVSSLERGDEVSIRVEYDRNNTPWADRIEVRSSARDDDRGGIWSSRVERLDGRVQAVDARRGYFTLTADRSERVVVYLTRDARRDDVRRFERLRRGERVRVDVRARGRGQAELVRFR